MRLLSTKPALEALNSTVKYLSFEGFAAQTMLSVHMLELDWIGWGPFYMTALQTSRLSHHRPRDMFGNVRIPDIGLLRSGRNLSHHSYDWLPIESQSALTYTSLLGLPIADIPKLGNVSFTIESSYWQVRCGPWTNADPGILVSRINSSGELFEYSGQTYTLAWSSGTMLDPWPPATNEDIKFDFDYYTKTSLGASGNKTSCTAAFQLVESVVVCEAAACVVQKMRHVARNVTSMFGVSPPMERVRTGLGSGILRPKSCQALILVQEIISA